MFSFQLLDLKIAENVLQKEIDMYFEKLRNIEFLCQEHCNVQNPIIKETLEILYATEVGII